MVEGPLVALWGLAALDLEGVKGCAVLLIKSFEAFLAFGANLSLNVESSLPNGFVVRFRGHGTSRVLNFEMYPTAPYNLRQTKMFDFRLTGIGLWRYFDAGGQNRNAQTCCAVNLAVCEKGAAP